MKETEKIVTNADGTKRELSNRHVQMIAIGGTIGTGLFLGASTAIHKTGPSILLVYAVVGLFFFLMMRAIGEMLYQDPSEHTFIAFITKYLGAGAGYFAGWTYWIGLVFLGMAELTAVATYVKFWFPHWEMWIIQVAFLLILLSVNLIAVRLFGEAEFWFAMIKIVAIIAMIAVGIGMVLINFKTPVGHASVGNILTNFTMFPHGAKNFIGAFPMVFFAFLGMEFVGITTAETKNPRQVLPKAINEIIIRILIFYMGAMLVIMAIYPWTSLDPTQSPFVQVFKLAGLQAAAAVINFVVLTSAASALNSSLFSAGRHFYQLASESDNRFMKYFRSISKRGVPARGIILSAALVLVSPIINSIPAITSGFEFVTSVSSDMYVIVYAMTMLAHRRYRASADFDAEGFLMPGYRFTSPATIGFFIVIFISLFFNQASVAPAIGVIVWSLGFGLLTHRWNVRAVRPVTRVNRVRD